MEYKSDMELDPRIIFAAERTLLAWIRTGLAMMGFGFVVARFSLLLKRLVESSQLIQTSRLQTPGMSLWIGVVLVLAGVVVNVVSGINYAREMRRLKSGLPPEIREWTFGRVVSLFLALIGIIMVAYLVYFAVQA